MKPSFMALGIGQIGAGIFLYTPSGSTVDIVAGRTSHRAASADGVSGCTTESPIAARIRSQHPVRQRFAIMTSAFFTTGSDGVAPQERGLERARSGRLTQGKSPSRAHLSRLKRAARSAHSTMRCPRVSARAQRHSHVLKALWKGEQG